MKYENSILLRCIECGSLDLSPLPQGVVCVACAASYGSVRGVPTFLKQGGLFTAQTAGDIRKNGFVPRAMRSLASAAPGLSFTFYAARAKSRTIARQARTGTCLVIGAGDNVSENAILRNHFARVVATDVSVNEGVDLVCDGHDLPFADDQFDFVVLTAVLEHVLDPQRVVQEVGRVLKMDGVVFAVTPFLQAVHMGAFDFQRFTDLGHRWLFKEFEQLERGTCGGPAASLLWSLSYFASSFGFSRISARLLGLGARLLFFWVKYFDFVLERGTACRDSANGFYFVGKNRKRPVIDAKDLIGAYTGRNR
jgi:SAM-dependent methyltransferase